MALYGNRKIYKSGRGRTITIPAEYIKRVEKQTGEIPTELAVEINGALHLKAIVNGKTVTLRHKK